MLKLFVRFGTGRLARGAYTAFINKFVMTKIYAALFCCLPLSIAFANGRDQDPTKVEFFERLYKMDIQGVKPYEEYQYPDTFYTEIASKVGIRQVAHTAVEKNLDGSRTTRDFLMRP